MKHELLVPVGNYESLVQAINFGADAVYLGGKKFGARAYADNFSLDELANATKLCHLYGVKIYVTVNTLIYESEVDEVLKYIKELHKMGVDALIMQDIGLINLVHQTLPNLEIHASTQMHNHNKYSIDFLKDLGIKRIVYARELSLDYINDIDTDIEKEVFIHGSLCISYSGECLFSSMILDRSGNRGECAGMCRLPYELYENNQKVNTLGKYLLSPKDLCSIGDFKKLMDSNIKSFKIEGRMKSPLYIALVTKIYRSLMDKYINNEELKVDEDDFFNLQAVFNREYTKGYLFNEKDIMNIYKPNHIGVYIGKVIEINKNKIAIKLNNELKQFSGIRFNNSDLGLIINYMYDKHDNLINKGNRNDVIYLDNKINLQELDDVYLTNPVIELNDNITKKININMEFKASLNNYATLKVTDGENEVLVSSEDLVEKSINSPITKERIKESLSKCGNTPFKVNNININIEDNLFIRINTLNELRRMALEKLQLLRENKRKEYIEKEYIDINNKQDITNNISILVRTKEQLQACLDLDIKSIITDKPLLMNKDLIYKLPKDLLELKDIPKDKKYLVTDYSTLYNLPNNYGDYSLNITNHYTLDYLSKYAKCLMLSIENKLDDIKDIMDNSHDKNVEVLAYGNIELMTMKYCIVNKFINKDDKCHVCFSDNKYYLKDRNNEEYRIITNPMTHGSSILNYKKTNLIKNIPKLKEMGITNFRIELLDENYEEVKKLIEDVRKYE